jgi:NAD-dependent dihydropyrimidine dehydrogenase PreA subunit
VHICDECVGLCKDIVAQEIDDRKAAKRKTAKSKTKENRLCGICMEARESDELIFLPHAAYMCAGCLEDIQTVRDKQSER